jgi:hypothetical protein
MLELILLTLMLLVSDVWGVNNQLYNEVSIFASSINKESVRKLTERMIIDVVNKESKIIKYMKNFNIFANKFKVCQIREIGLIKVKSMQKIKSIRLLV